VQNIVLSININFYKFCKITPKQMRIDNNGGI